MPTVSAMVLMKFQLSSTALTVTVKPLKEAAGDGCPTLPVGVPAAAISPGNNNWSLLKGPILTLTLALVLAASALAASVAVIVRVPAVLKVKLERMRAPETRFKLPAVAPLSSATAALPSELVMMTFGVALLTTFQFASTARTTIPLLSGALAVWSGGAPVLPAAVPGAAVSPGNRI